MTTSGDIEPYKGISEYDAGLGKSEVWGAYAAIPAAAVVGLTNIPELKHMFGKGEAVKWSGKGKAGVGVGLGVLAAGQIAGWVSGQNQAKAAHEQYDSMAQKITQLSTENDMLKASGNWADSEASVSPEQSFAAKEDGKKEAAEYAETQLS